MSRSAHERRRWPRFGIVRGVNLVSEAGDVLARAELVDLSSGGALISVPVDVSLSLGQVVVLELDANDSPSGRMLQYTCKARILRCEDNQTGRKDVAVAFLGALAPKLGQGRHRVPAAADLARA